MAHAEILGPAAWRESDMVDASHWRRHLTKPEIAEIDAALRHAKSVGAVFGDLTKEQFPLPTVASVIAGIREQLVEGPGIQLFKGFPVTNYDDHDIRLIYWGIAVHLGMPVSQSKFGDLIGDVRDMGVSAKSHGGRGYTSSGKLSFHSDAADVTGLFCLQTAETGGESLIASAQAIHNEIARTRPDLLEVLYTAYHWSWRGQNRPEEPAWYLQPVYGECEGYFASRYLRSSIDFAQSEDGVPDQTEIQKEALDYLDKIANDPAFHFRMMFEPGDIQFVNNQLIYHARTAFEDAPAPDNFRHLLRLWMSIPNSRPLPQSFGALYRDQGAGAVRGGYPQHEEKKLFATPPEAGLQH